MGKEKKKGKNGCIFSRGNFLRNFLRRRSKELVLEEVHWTDEQKEELSKLIHALDREKKK